jgi:type II secretory pathway predicted ATPase ExeA
MTNRHGANPIIRTSAHAILKVAASAALETAQLAIARGPAGIGKSFALTLLQQAMLNDRDRIYVFTATAHNGRSVKRFFQELIIECEIRAYGRTEPMQRLESALLQSRPFQASAPRVLLVIDECQHLDGKLIECLRALFDLGFYARNFDRSQPAFGLLLVGNGNFLSRGGRAERAAFDALLTRCPIEVTLERPSGDEIQSLAKCLLPENEALQEAFAEHGARHGNLRVMDTAVDMARYFAGGDDLTMAELQKAFLFAAGGK